nr:MAG TPA: hypothetical protein [Caudoviricetes sp.]
MSHSSLYGIDKDYKGNVIEVFRNSWLFAPIIRCVLTEKYIPPRKLISNGFKRNIIFDTSLCREVHSKINNCDNTADRICWEISGGHVFFTKDKNCAANAIRDFVKQNNNYCRDDKDNVPVLEREHIIKRFEKIASAIELLPEDTPYFVMKNTSVDDSVERWFRKYDDEQHKYVESSLSQVHELVTEFVVIEDGKIVNFINNLEFEY